LEVSSVRKILTKEDVVKKLQIVVLKTAENTP